MIKWIHKLLTYKETVWGKKNGYKTRKIQVRIKSIQSSETIKEQRAKIEKISLVVFLNKEQKKILMNISRRLKRNDSDFYQNSNLHVTVLGFGPIDKMYHSTIQNKIQEFSQIKRDTKLTLIFNTIRPGTMYSNDTRMNTVSGLSNGMVVCLGNVHSNKEFCNYSNRLASFLLKDKKIKLALGANFRKKLPSVWCSLGYYEKHGRFKIGQNLETIFEQYDNLRQNFFKFDVSEISLVKSNYKNLRYPTILYKYRV
jgi:hypothetical protein